MLLLLAHLCCRSLVVRRRLCAAAHWFQMSKNPPKHKFPFPVACASHTKFVKPLQAQVRFVDFTNFLNLVFGGILHYGPTVRRRRRHQLAPLRLPPPSPIMPRLSCTGNSSLEPRNEGSYNTVGLCVAT